MSNEHRILRAIEAVYPDWISNAKLLQKSGIKPHQQVFQLTHKLRTAGRVQGEQHGREWVFRAQPGITPEPKIQEPNDPKRSAGAECRYFEATVRSMLSLRLGVTLKAAEVLGVPKKFDLVSPDGAIVGDAKYFDLVNGTSLPPAKFSVIAEHVWLLEKTSAKVKFLVFGNNRQVPEKWFRKYGNLVRDVSFLFIDQAGATQVIHDPTGTFSVM